MHIINFLLCFLVCLCVSQGLYGAEIPQKSPYVLTVLAKLSQEKIGKYKIGQQKIDDILMGSWPDKAKFFIRGLMAETVLSEEDECRAQTILFQQPVTITVADYKTMLGRVVTKK